MTFDPFEFYGGGNDFFNYGYGNGYGGNAIGNVMNSFYWVIGLLIAAIVIGVVINFTFLRRKNEGKFHGFWEKAYNFFSFNRFYSEGIVKLLSIITFFILTIMGIYMICTGEVISGILMITLGNIGARLGYELTMMFIIFCKKTVSMDKKLSTISRFYDDMEDWDFHDASDEGLKEENSSTEAMADMPDNINDESVFEPAETAEAAVAEKATEAVVTEAEEPEAVKVDEPAQAVQPESSNDEIFKEKLKAALGDPDAPKYGYDEECKTCDNWSAEEQDCYCPDDCLTCDKPDADEKADVNAEAENVVEEAAETALGEGK